MLYLPTTRGCPCKTVIVVRAGVEHVSWALMGACCPAMLANLEPAGSVSTGGENSGEKCRPILVGVAPSSAADSMVSVDARLLTC
jgi:hypothetical protein